MRYLLHDLVAWLLCPPLGQVIALCYRTNQPCMIFEAICTCQLALFKGLAFGTHSRALHWRDDGPDSVTIFIEVFQLKGGIISSFAALS